MESDVAFDFLNNLVNVAVQHCDRAKAAQSAHQLIRITGAPAPGFVNSPERHVREDHDRGARGSPLEIGFHPGELFGAQGAQAARLELQHVDQADEMHAGMIEAVVALVAGRLAESDRKSVV